MHKRPHPFLSLFPQPIVAQGARAIYAMRELVQLSSICPPACPALFSFNIKWLDWFVQLSSFIHSHMCACVRVCMCVCQVDRWTGGHMPLRHYYYFIFQYLKEVNICPLSCPDKRSFCPPVLVLPVFVRVAKIFGIKNGGFIHA